MRTHLLAAALSLSAPGLAAAQCVNPSGMTLPNFQAAYLLSHPDQDTGPTPRIIAGTQAKVLVPHPAKLVVADDTTAAPASAH
jgi:hypothetical protein